MEHGGPVFGDLHAAGEQFAQARAPAGSGEGDIVDLAGDQNVNVDAAPRRRYQQGRRIGVRQEIGIRNPEAAHRRRNGDDVEELGRRARRLRRGEDDLRECVAGRLEPGKETLSREQFTARCGPVLLEGGLKLGDDRAGDLDLRVAPVSGFFGVTEPDVGDSGAAREPDLPVHDEDAAVRSVVDRVEHPGTERMKEFDDASGGTHRRDVVAGELGAGADRVQKDSNLYSRAGSFAQGVAETAGDLARPEDIRLEVDRALRPCDCGQHGREKRVAVLEQPDPVAFDGRRVRERVSGRKKRLLLLHAEMVREAVVDLLRNRKQRERDGEGEGDRKCDQVRLDANSVDFRPPWPARPSAKHRKGLCVGKATLRDFSFAPRGRVLSGSASPGSWSFSSRWDPPPVLTFFPRYGRFTSTSLPTAWIARTSGVRSRFSGRSCPRTTARRFCVTATKRSALCSRRSAALGAPSIWSCTSSITDRPERSSRVRSRSGRGPAWKCGCWWTASARGWEVSKTR